MRNWSLLRGAVAPIVVGAALMSGRVWAAECPLAGQQPMLVVQMYFGQDIERQAPISASRWNAFVREDITPRFPDGLTIYDARGQWMNPKTRAIGHERTKVVQIAVPLAPSLDAKIADVAAAYRSRFHQQSVGIVTNTGCGAF